METSNYKLINKEMVSSLHFHKEIEIDQNSEIKNKLETAAKLGNNYHSKVGIFFHDDEGPKRIETTVWAVGTKFICLKGGLWLPISRIEDVDFSH